jgi:phosphoenolpyruvate---glycerone phosphotransferase subunit DhaL
VTRGLTTASLRWAIERFSEKMRLCAEELNALDAALGDGDLGVNMVRASERLKGEAANLPDDVGMALLKSAQAFTSVSASTYGTLLATGLMAAARLTKGREVVPWPETSSLLAAAAKSMADRGKGSLGDKTVLDAVEAASGAAEGLDEPGRIAAASVAAISEALDQLRGQPFRQGRARMFGEKGLGLDDPGMVAFQRIVEGLLPPKAD